MSSANERVVKVLVIGDAATGKTSVIKQYAYSDFSEQHIATATVDFTLKLVKRGDITYRLQLWDIAGQDRFQNISRVYYRNAFAAFIVCDGTRKETLDNVEKWKNQLGDKAFLPNGMPLPVILLVNKSDIETDCISDSDINEVCSKNEISLWLRVSAKTGQNIQECMNKMIDAVTVYNDIWENDDESDGVIIPERNCKKKGCC